jgi:hypothetical protein
MFRRSALALALCLAAGCSLPEGDPATPSGAHYRWLEVRAAGDIAGMWELLDPNARQEFEKWLLVEKLMLNEIRTAYPKEDVEAALKAIGGSERGELADAKALFGKYAVAGQIEPVGGMAAAGARVRSEVIDESGTSATVRTWGGDEVRLVATGDGRWYVPFPEMERLRGMRERAEQNLDRVRKNLKKLGRQGQ